MSYEHEPHTFLKKKSGLTVCAKCGLIPLNNLLTDWCVRKGCNHTQHNEWKRVRIDLVQKHQER